jgi:hypothetical protein
VSDRALTRNAADRRQRDYAEKIAADRYKRFQAVTRAVLNTATGREFVVTLLEQSGLFISSFDHSGSQMYFNEGRRKFGLELDEACELADAAMFELMHQERRARRRKDDAATDAVHTASAEDRDSE